MVKEALLEESVNPSCEFDSRKKKIARREVWQKVGVMFAAPPGR